MSKEDLCEYLSAIRQSHLDQALRIRDIWGDPPKDPVWERILRRHDDTATDIDQLMIDAGCM